MQKKQKIKAYFYILENYANALSCGWQTAALSHPPLPKATASACFTTDVKSRPSSTIELKILFFSPLFLQYSYKAGLKIYESLEKI
ncbi:hypothetical protein CJ305_16615 [Leeuwenhoekiella nanhaiensis]|uniref:Uncharacterized protein n=1 Tax=Leeuwenhoekiella nanhaiensis TaxID=1655491 RepID=A0A2G1VMW6_9FLAO|nr:hypothetical protein CJ305_16615 [Leeuwenhoekiella nanhaiensis]